jgi:hypothetical protein
MGIEGRMHVLRGRVLLGCAVAVAMWMAPMGAAFAGGRGEVRKQTEMSMLLNGQIVIERDGTVQEYVLDDAAGLPPVTTQLLDKATRHWRFDPIAVDGNPVRARTAMSVRLVAKPLEDGRFDVRVAAANFGKPGEGEFITSSAPLKPPRYPELAGASGVGGTVYVVVRVGRDGKVEDAMAEQVNLRVVDTENGMARWRDMLAQAALRGVRNWTFVPPTKGDEVDEPFWLARVPVDFLLHDQETVKPGKWEAYIPGPRQTAPWLGGVDTSLGADAVAGSGIFPVKGGPRLLTPLDEGT